MTSFDWDSMTDGEPTTEKGRTAIAQLMRYCGQSVNMDYDMGISGSCLESAAMPCRKISTTIGVCKYPILRVRQKRNGKHWSTMS